MDSRRIINLDDFFDFKSKKPINRLAYTEDDLNYKIKVIKKMQELGMSITLDRARKYLWYYFSWK